MTKVVQGVKMNLAERIMIVDVETAGGLGTPFIYDVGFIVATLHNGQYIPLEMKSYVVEQVWNNRDLFDTAYYAEKRGLYVSKMRGRTTKLKERHLIWAKMRHLIKKYDVTHVLAYNFDFDGRAFRYNSERFNVINPLEILNSNCIWKMALNTICKEDDYLSFVKTHDMVTESGKSYKTSAESVYAYLKNTPEFIEEHTGLEDSIIEMEILNYLIENYDIDFDKKYTKVFPPELSDKTFELSVKNPQGEYKNYKFKYNRMKKYKGRTILERY